MAKVKDTSVVDDKKTIEQQSPVITMTPEQLQAMIDKSIADSKIKNDVADPKAKYEGPRKYSYSIYAGLPVCSMESFKKDKRYQLVFRNEYGQWVSNQMVRLILSDGKTIEAPYDDYMANKETSEKVFVKNIEGKGEDAKYVFEVDGETFSVDKNVIN